MVIYQPTSSHPQGLNRKQTLWLVVIGMVAILISLYAGIALATSNNYAHWPCHYSPGTINPISYEYYSVQRKGRYAFEQGKVIWNNTSVPGYLERRANNPDVTHRFAPDLGVFDTVFLDFERSWVGKMNYFGCQLLSGTNVYHNNYTTISFNTNFYDTHWMTDELWRVVAMHEIGHSYGLAHTYRGGCALMNSPIPIPLCTSNFPTPSDIAGIHALYPNVN